MTWPDESLSLFLLVRTPILKIGQKPLVDQVVEASLAASQATPIIIITIDTIIICLVTVRI